METRRVERHQTDSTISKHLTASFHHSFLKMSRESFFPTQSSSSQHPQTLDINNLPPIYQTYLQKQQEYAGLQALKEASGEMIHRVEQLAGMSSIMADGGEGESLHRPQLSGGFEGWD